MSRAPKSTAWAERENGAGRELGTGTRRRAPEIMAKQADAFSPRAFLPHDRYVAPAAPGRPPLDAAPTPPAAASQARRAPPLVLIVDDNAEVRAMYDELLRFAGYRTEVAENGRVAVERATAQRPDVILLDHEMPVMHGADAARCLRNDPRTRDVPIVMLTALPRPPHGSADWDHYLVKPCVPDDVLEVVEALLHAHRGESRS